MKTKRVLAYIVTLCMLIGLMPAAAFADSGYTLKCEVTEVNGASGTVYYKVDEGNWTAVPAPGGDGFSYIPLPELSSTGESQANDWFVYFKAVPDEGYFVNSSTSFYQDEWDDDDKAFDTDSLLSDEGQSFTIIGPASWFFKIEFDNNEGGPAPVGFFSTPEASEQSAINSFTRTDTQDSFYLISLDEHERFTSVEFNYDEEISWYEDYDDYLSIEPVQGLEGQVYEITVDSEAYRWDFVGFKVAFTNDENYSDFHYVGLEITNGLPWFGHVWPEDDGQGNMIVPDSSNIDYDFYMYRAVSAQPNRPFDLVLIYDDQLVTDSNLLDTKGNLTVAQTNTQGIWTLTLTGTEEAQLVYSDGSSNRYKLNIDPYIPEFAAYASQDAAQADYIDEFEVTADNNAFFIINHSDEITLTNVTPESWCADYTSVSKISASVYKVVIDSSVNDNDSTCLKVDYDYTDYNGDPASDYDYIEVRLHNSIPRLLFEYARYDDNTQKHIYPTGNDVYWRSELADFPEGTATIAIAFDGTPVTEGLSAEGVEFAPNSDAPGLYDVTIEKGASGTITYSGADSYNTIPVRSVLPNSGLYSSATASFDTLLNAYNDVKLSMADSLYWIFTVPDLDESAVEVTQSAIEGAVSIGTKQAGQNGITVYPITLNKDVIDGRDLSFYIHSSFVVLEGLSEDGYEQVNVWAPESITFVYDDPAHGSGSADPESAYKDDEVTVTITPDRGYEIARYTEGNFNVEFAHGAADGGRLVMKSEQEPDGQYTDNGDGTFTVIMPEDGLWVLPHFETAYYNVTASAVNAATDSAVTFRLIPEEDPDSPFDQGELSRNVTPADDGTAVCSFEGVTFRNYTIEVVQGSKNVTDIVEITADTEIPALTLPELNLTTEVNNTSGVQLSVSGLSDAANEADEVTAAADTAVETEDSAETKDDVDLTVTMNVSSVTGDDLDAATDDIGAADGGVSSGSISLDVVLDITIDIEARVNGQVVEAVSGEAIAETAKVLDIALNHDVAGKSITVYRIHDGNTEKLRQLETAPAKGSEVDGTYFVEEFAGKIHIYTDKFSVYAIGSETAYSIGFGTLEGMGDVSFSVNGIAAGQAPANATVTVNAVPSSGYQLGSISVEDAAGSAVSVSGNTFVMPATSVAVSVSFTEVPQVVTPADDLISPAPATPAAVQFTDVADTAWYKEAVDYVAEHGYFYGVTATEFAPDKAMDRAMFATVLYRIAGEPAFSGASSFSDVESGRYYSTPIAWAEANGFMGGKGGGIFDPEGEISRQEMAVTLYRYVKSQGKGFTGLWAFQLDFSDADQVADWAYEAVCWMSMNKVLNGKGGGVLDPKGSAKRSEVAQMIMNFDKLED